MSTEPHCNATYTPNTLPGLSSDSFYCLTANTANLPSFTNMSTACCGPNALQKIGGCDYCVIDTPTDWSNSSRDVGVSDEHIRLGMLWDDCLIRRGREFGTNQTRISSSCHFPGEESGASVAAAVGGRAGWAVWGLVMVMGVGWVEGLVF